MFSFHHARQYGFRYNKRSIQIDIDYLTELRCCHFVHRDAANNTSIVYQDIDGAYFFFDLRNHSLYSRFIRYVTYVTMYSDTFFVIRSQTFVYQFLVNVVEADFCTLFCKGRSDCKTNTIGSTCYEGYLAFQRKIQIRIHNV